MWIFRKPKIFIINKVLPDQREWRSLHLLADSARPEMIRVFLKAVAATQGAVVLKDVEKAMAIGNLKAAVAAIPWATFETELGPLGVIFSNIFAKAGQNSIEYLPKEMQLEVSFTALNPKSIDYIALHTGELIKEILEETRNAVKQIVNRAFVEGMHPYESARYIREIVGLTTRQALAVDNLRKKLMEKKLSAKVIERRAKTYTKKLIIWRSKNIARTETMTAANAGTYNLHLQLIDQGLVNKDIARKKYILTPDDALCPFCAAVRSQTQPIDKPFVTPKGEFQFPPIHPQCRCSYGLIYDTL